MLTFGFDSEIDFERDVIHKLSLTKQKILFYFILFSCKDVYEYSIQEILINNIM